MKQILFVIFTIGLNASTGQAQSELDQLKLCYQQALSLELKEVGRGKNQCVDEILSACRRAKEPKSCFSTVDKSAERKARRLSADLYGNFKEEIAANERIASMLSRSEGAIGISACDASTSLCDAMSAVWVYASIIDISHELHEISGGSQ